MKTIDYFAYLVENIHTTIIATVDDAGHPVTSAIDMMDYDESGLYFLTAKGKKFYQRLKAHPHIALTGLKGESTMTSVALSLQGEVKEIGPDYLPRLFSKNPYMYEIYPNETARETLTVFKIERGHGEWFDLSKRPIERDQFTFGDDDMVEHGFFITNQCIGCGACVAVCPQLCIVDDQVPFQIEHRHCLRCGACLKECPVNAIKRK
ncbi:MAG: 4Fe-4S binding protein [Erysipelotrichaceae bacterium]|nr:4Fe-4S binding protein [Erysipelotrichaceae bacterium]